MKTNELINNAFTNIAPFWPLKNLIAVNPLHGLEQLPIEEALKLAAAYFERGDLPEPMEAINRETIKWLQAFFDENQATLAMPYREHGLFFAWKKLVLHDKKLHGNDATKIAFIKNSIQDINKLIPTCLSMLGIEHDEHELFITLLLTTLAGWSSYIKYINNPHTELEYVALRLMLTVLIWPEAKQLLIWHKQYSNDNVSAISLEQVQQNEQQYRNKLLNTIKTQEIIPNYTPVAQFVFCIDVRSEPFRRALESLGDYQTFGFAGFFGIPVQIHTNVPKQSYASCPVLLKPQHQIYEIPNKSTKYNSALQSYKILNAFKRLYQALKYSFTTPFALVESLGIIGGVLMLLRNLVPNKLAKCKQKTIDPINYGAYWDPDLEEITTDDKLNYAFSALKMMGLTKNFAKYVFLCGHGSITTNNAYATALDCGACGGRHGANNAKILAKILNLDYVRAGLETKNIFIPENTVFLAAEHNTTTDAVKLYNEADTESFEAIVQDLKKAQKINSIRRLKLLTENFDKSKAITEVNLRAHDWSQVRPEWGLARNAAFIVGPRSLTQNLDLEGRCFLHSYNYLEDPDGSYLTTILTAPMVVAQWINAQYLFSTANNIAYGGGSKITKNITGKIGIMQGNASDLMTGLPLQSVFYDDLNNYHELQRLMTVVFASPEQLSTIIAKQTILQKLFGNGWVQLVSLDPGTHKIYILDRDLKWQECATNLK